MKFDIWLYTSDEEYQDGTATRDQRGLSHEEVGVAIAGFESEYRGFMDSNGGRLVVSVEPSKPDRRSGKDRREPLKWAEVAARGDWYGQPADWRATIRREREARTKLSTGPSV